MTFFNQARFVLSAISFPLNRSVGVTRFCSATNTRKAVFEFSEGITGDVIFAEEDVGFLYLTL